jgi:hypothetical protein
MNKISASAIIGMLLLLSAPPASAATKARAKAANGIPTFDITKNCNEEVAGGLTTAAACVKDETDAKNELTKRWSEFDATNRKSCAGMSAMGGEQSYVELLSCLEMSTGGHFSGGPK